MRLTGAFIQSEKHPLHYILLPLILCLLSACGDGVEKVVNDINDSTESRRGVYVHLGSDLQKAIAIPNSRTEITLHITGASSAEYSLTISGDTASVKPPKSTGEQDYSVQIWYRQVENDTPLLLAEANKTSAKSRVEFAADDIHTTAFDRNGDGDIDETEKWAFNFDGDDISNLAEVIEGGNPRKSVPTFLSP